MTTSAALKNLWWTTVLCLGYVWAIFLVRLLYWPPDVSPGPYVEPGGFLTFLGILIFGYLVFCIWHYVIKSVVVLFVGNRRTMKRWSAVKALFRSAAGSAALLTLPAAMAIAFEFPDPFDIVPLGLVFATIWYINRFAPNAVEKLTAELFA